MNTLEPRLVVPAVQRFGRGCRCGPWATTRVHTDGQYPRATEAEAGVGQSTRGSSRDHRPEWTPVGRELLGDRPAGLPLLRDPLNGNRSEKGRFRDPRKTHLGHLQTEGGRASRGAASARYPADTLPPRPGCFWFSRLPDPRGLARALRQTGAPAGLPTPAPPAPGSGWVP